MYGSGVGDEKIISIFASQDKLHFFADSEHWYADGTFKVYPEVFFHLYTIHGYLDRRILPCVFLLLPNKNENAYNRLIEQLFQLVNNLGNGPNDVLVGFERSEINAFQNQNIEAQGCFYHLPANIWKHTQHLRLSQRYNQEEEFALHIRMLPVLAFLPAGYVIEGFGELVDTIRVLYDEVADDLLHRFEDTYIGRYRRNAPRRPPLFAINLWNMFNRTDDESPPPRQRYLDSSRRILRILDDYPNRKSLQFLRVIAHNLIF